MSLRNYNLMILLSANLATISRNGITPVPAAKIMCLPLSSKVNCGPKGPVTVNFLSET